MRTRNVCTWHFFIFHIVYEVVQSWNQLFIKFAECSFQSHECIRILYACMLPLNEVFIYLVKCLTLVLFVSFDVIQAQIFVFLNSTDMKIRKNIQFHINIGKRGWRRASLLETK